MTLAFTNPTVVPTHSALIGTSFWITSVTSTAGGGGAGGGPCLQPNPMTTHAVPTIAARRAHSPDDALLDIRGVSDNVRFMSRIHPQLPCRPQRVRRRSGSRRRGRKLDR